jgi:hypothetical protein
LYEVETANNWRALCVFFRLYHARERAIPRLTNSTGRGQPRCPVNGVLELLRGAGFDPEAIEIIYEAYVKTRRTVCDIGKPDPVNEIIALRILSLAKQGERDPDRLRAGALATLPVQPRL